MKVTYLIANCFDGSDREVIVEGETKQDCFDQVMEVVDEENKDYCVEHWFIVGRVQ